MVLDSKSRDKRVVKGGWWSVGFAMCCRASESLPGLARSAAFGDGGYRRSLEREQLSE